MAVEGEWIEEAAPTRSVPLELVDDHGRGCEQCAKFKAEAGRANGWVRYWRTQHQRAVAREAELKAKIEELKAQIRERDHRLCGEKSERSKSKASGKDAQRSKRKRGQQRGAVGHGRRRRGEHLPSVEEVWDLDPERRHCATCQRPYDPLKGSEDSEIIEVEVRAHRRVIRRKRYRPSCRCSSQPGIVTAPGPAKLTPKGSLGISVWVSILVDKFLFQRPTYRLLSDLRLTQDLSIAQGTVTGGLRRLVPLFEPVMKAVIERNLSARHWHADETGWPVYVEHEGKQGYHWQLWLFQSKETVVFRVEPTRAGKVVEAYFGKSATGILSVDRYVAYRVLLKKGRIVLAYCWAHMRRDFVRVGRDWGGQHEQWALGWVECIRELYRLNDERLRLRNDAHAFARADGELHDAVERMAVWRGAELAHGKLAGCRLKVLKSMAKHWDGLTVFLAHPEVPMDNNAAERSQRNPVVGRKNYCGSGALWSAQLAAMMFSIFQTVLLWKINPRLWLRTYLEQCARNGGQAPSDIAPFLPWKMSEERRAQLSGGWASGP